MDAAFDPDILSEDEHAPVPLQLTGKRPPHCLDQIDARSISTRLGCPLMLRGCDTPLTTDLLDCLAIEEYVSRRGAWIRLSLRECSLARRANLRLDILGQLFPLLRRKNAFPLEKAPQARERIASFFLGTFFGGFVGLVIGARVST